MVGEHRLEVLQTDSSGRLQGIPPHHPEHQRSHHWAKFEAKETDQPRQNAEQAFDFLSAAIFAALADHTTSLASKFRNSCD
ncbi:MAG: hypothetical protein R2867_27130 [Caldilineaceae bacterium]